MAILLFLITEVLGGGRGEVVKNCSYLFENFPDGVENFFQLISRVNVKTLFFPLYIKKLTNIFCDM